MSIAGLRQTKLDNTEGGAGARGEGLANLAIFTDAYLLMIGVRLLTIRFDGSHN